MGGGGGGGMEEGGAGQGLRRWAARMGHRAGRAMQAAEVDARKEQAAEEAATLRREVSRLAEALASVERRNLQLEADLPGEVLREYVGDRSAPRKGSGLSETMKDFLRNRFGALADKRSHNFMIQESVTTLSPINSAGPAADSGSPEVFEFGRDRNTSEEVLLRHGRVEVSRTRNPNGEISLGLGSVKSVRKSLRHGLLQEHLPEAGPGPGHFTPRTEKRNTHVLGSGPGARSSEQVQASSPDSTDLHPSKDKISPHLVIHKYSKGVTVRGTVQPTQQSVDSISALKRDAQHSEATLQEDEADVIEGISPKRQRVFVTRSSRPGDPSLRGGSDAQLQMNFPEESALPVGKSNRRTLEHEAIEPQDIESPRGKAKEQQKYLVPAHSEIALQTESSHAFRQKFSSLDEGSDIIMVTDGNKWTGQRAKASTISEPEQRSEEVIEGSQGSELESGVFKYVSSESEGESSDSEFSASREVEVMKEGTHRHRSSSADDENCETVSPSSTRLEGKYLGSSEDANSRKKVLQSRRPNKKKVKKGRSAARRAEQARFKMERKGSEHESDGLTSEDTSQRECKGETNDSNVFPGLKSECSLEMQQTLPKMNAKAAERPSREEGTNIQDIHGEDLANGARKMQTHSNCLQKIEGPDALPKASEEEAVSSSEEEAATSSGREDDGAPPKRRASKAAAAKKQRRKARSKAAGPDALPEASEEEAVSRMERDVGEGVFNCEGFHVGTGNFGGSEGNNLESFFQESHPDMSSQEGGEALAVQNVHLIPDIPEALLRTVLQGNPQRVSSIEDLPESTHNGSAHPGNDSEERVGDQPNREKEGKALEAEESGYVSKSDTDPLTSGEEEEETHYVHGGPPVEQTSEGSSLDLYFTETRLRRLPAEDAASVLEDTKMNDGAGIAAADVANSLAPMFPGTNAEDIVQQLSQLIAGTSAGARGGGGDPRVDAIEREVANVFERGSIQDSHLKDIEAMLRNLMQSTVTNDERLNAISVRLQEQEAQHTFVQQASLLASSEKVKSLEQVVETSRKKDRVLKAHIQDFSALLDAIMVRQNLKEELRAGLLRTERQSSQSEGHHARQNPDAESLSRIKETLGDNTRGELSGESFREDIPLGEATSRGEGYKKYPHEEQIVDDFLKLSQEKFLQDFGRNAGPTPDTYGGISELTWHGSVHAPNAPAAEIVGEPSFDDMMQSAPMGSFASEMSMESLFLSGGGDSEGEDSPIFAPKGAAGRSSAALTPSPNRSSSPFLSMAAAMRFKSSEKRNSAQREKVSRDERKAETQAPTSLMGRNSSPFTTAAAAMRFKAVAKRAEKQRGQDDKDAGEAVNPTPGSSARNSSPFMTTAAAMRFKAAAKKQIAKREKVQVEAWEEEMLESLVQPDDIEKCIRDITMTKKKSISTATLATTAAMRFKSKRRGRDEEDFTSVPAEILSPAPVITDELLESMATAIYVSDSESESEGFPLRLFQSPAPSQNAARSSPIPLSPEKSPQRPPWYPPGSQIPH